VAEPLLKVRNLSTYFFTEDGVVRAVDGVSLDIHRGEIVGLVGESGCGKTVTALSIMRLIPSPPGRIVSGEIWFEGVDLLKLDDDGIRSIRGHKIAMVFQEPMTSLNPVLTIGRQLTEPLEVHLKMEPRQARARAIELLEMVGIPEPHKRIDSYPPPVLGGDEATSDDRHGPGM
jgi:oligopeptide transport system ATP-binding protein